MPHSSSTDGRINMWASQKNGPPDPAQRHDAVHISGSCIGLLLYTGHANGAFKQRSNAVRIAQWAAYPSQS